ncbi:hypothetical protein [Nocardia sp. NPDC057353]|uniref:Rv0361 family membrane protein n=1 Tax=Nocardia sp. NPDC057353 TaxID=3346104 RepID=UPI0036359F4F
MGAQAAGGAAAAQGSADRTEKIARPEQADNSADETVAMRTVPAPGDADAPTQAFAVQQQGDPDGVTQRIQRTDRVPGAVPLSKPPSTPRPAPGPKQAGAQRPTGPNQVEETRPSDPQRPAEPRQVASAPSPADIQPTRPAQQQQRPIAPPQRIEPQPQPQPAAQQGGSKKLLLIGGAAVVVIVALVAVIAALAGGGGDSPETQVRAAISQYTSALDQGDLAGLRDSTCGALHDYYQGISEADFAGVHEVSQQSGSIPVVEKVDAVRVTDGTALAQATVFIRSDPNTKTERTFDLQRTDAGWKVCEPPTGAS